MKCIYSNVDSIVNKLTEIEIFLKANDIDVAAFTEIIPKNTSLDYDPNGKNFVIEGYTSIEDITDRGVCIFVKDHYEIQRFPDLENLFRPSLFCKISSSKDDFITLGLIYRSPNSSVEECEQINKQIELASNKFKNNEDKFIIVGDFNFPDINWLDETCNHKSDNIQTKFLNCIQSNFLKQWIQEPTHYRVLQKPTLIDLVITKDPDLITEIIEHPPFGKSHHKTILFKVEHEHMKKGPTIPKLQLEKGKYNEMRLFIQNINWEQILLANDSVDDWWGIISNKINEAIEKYVPKRNYKFTNNKPKRSFFAPTSLHDKFKCKRQAFKHYKKYPTQENYNRYAKFRNQVKWEVRKNKIEKEKSIAKKVKLNPKAFYQYIASKTKPKDSIPNIKKDNGELTDNDKDKCEALNAFFQSVFTKEDNNETINSNNNSNLNIKYPLYEATAFEEDMIFHLKNLNTSKSPGPDEIHPRVLKELSEQLAHPLCLLFDKSMDAGKLPTAWKTAEIRPIHKKGSKSIASNYRPISLTSIVCKIFEHFVKKALHGHLVLNKILSPHQYGFCSGRSCTTQLLTTIHSWMEWLDQNIPVDAIYLDFQKAFDTVPHSRLLMKLEKYGVKNNILNWIGDFLSDRQQYVSINGARSSTLPVTSGVPQGSVLGPTLFIYYINDLPEVTTTLSKLFADDTKAYSKMKDTTDRDNLQSGISSMDKWTIEWLLKFNEEKIHALHLGKNNPNYDYYIGENNTLINTSTLEKDLGVFIDPELNFEDHIINVTKKARKISSLIIRTITHKSPDIMVPLFKSLVRPILEYGNAVWAPYKVKDKNQIESVQRHFTKVIIGMKDLDYSQRLEQLNLPSLEFRRLRGDMIEVYKILHEKYDPETTSTLLTLTSSNSSTRSNDFKLVKIRPNTDRFKYFFTNRVVNPWNNLPKEIVNASNVNTFKNHIDLHFSEILYQTNFNPYY